MPREPSSILICSPRLLHRWVSPAPGSLSLELALVRPASPLPCLSSLPLPGPGSLKTHCSGLVGSSILWNPAACTPGGPAKCSQPTHLCATLRASSPGPMPGGTGLQHPVGLLTVGHVSCRSLLQTEQAGQRQSHKQVLQTSRLPPNRAGKGKEGEQDSPAIWFIVPAQNLKQGLSVQIPSQFEPTPTVCLSLHCVPSPLPTARIQKWVGEFSSPAGAPFLPRAGHHLVSRALRPFQPRAVSVQAVSGCVTSRCSVAGVMHTGSRALAWLLLSGA